MRMLGTNRLNKLVNESKGYQYEEVSMKNLANQIASAKMRMASQTVRILKTL
jgi:hypothetical protein